MRIVLDTNVLISGTFWTGNSFRILELTDNGKVVIIISQKLVEEYNEVINREEILEKIENKNLTLNNIVQKVISNAVIVSPSTKLDISQEDPDDNIVLECAVEGKADFIISQDNHLLKLGEFQGIKIVTPEEFLRK